MAHPDSALCATARQPDPRDSPVVSHRAVLLVLGVGGLLAFAVWQFTGIEHYLNALGGFCM